MTKHRAFDTTTGMLRFSVPLEHGLVTAYLSQSVWQARHGLAHSDSSFVEIYLANQPMIDAAVVRKVRAGARMPVVLKVADL
jgi:hypothetical protein